MVTVELNFIKSDISKYNSTSFNRIKYYSKGVRIEFYVIKMYNKFNLNSITELHVNLTKLT